MDVSFTLGEIEERDFGVAAQPGRDDISVCTCTGFCLRETGRNGCLCSSAQQFCTSSCHRARGTASLWMNTRSVAVRFFRKWRGIKVYLFFPCGKIFVQLQTSETCTLFHKLLRFFIVAKTTFHHVRLTNNSGLSLHNTDWKSTLRARFQTECSKSTGTFTCLIQGSFVFYCVKYYSTNKSKLSHNLCCQYIASTEHSRQ